MNNKNKFFLSLSIYAALLVFGVTTGVTAQEQRNSRAETKKAGDWMGQPSTPPASGLNRNAAESTSVSGAIRWLKQYGLPPTGFATNVASPVPCGLMFVTATQNVGEPGSFGRQEPIATSFDQSKAAKFLQAKEDGDYYVCPYLINGLPRGVNLTIAAQFLDAEYEAIRWIGSEEMLTAEKARVLTGVQSVTLTDAQPNVVINFEIKYAPLPSMPR